MRTKPRKLTKTQQKLVDQFILTFSGSTFSSHDDVKDFLKRQLTNLILSL